jgi:uncharacterized membrane protein
VFIREYVSMKIHILAVMASLILLSFFPCGIVHGQNTVEYQIQIDNEGSGIWVIRQTGTEIPSSIDTLTEFRSRVVSLVTAAENRTERPMAAKEDEFSLTFNYSGSYVIVEYRFYWQNFSKIGDTSIIIGDVFQVQNFFSQLYGDGTVYVTYPSQYVVETVSPPPSKRDDSAQALEWPGTLDFKQEVRIVLEKSTSSGLIEILLQNAVLIGSLAVAIVGSSVEIYAFRRRRKKEPGPAGQALPQSPLDLESDEEKVVKMVKSSGGRVYQSAVTDHFKFSKAKTSQLLSALEHKGIVKRYRQGRDKIVVLVEMGGARKNET